MARRPSRERSAAGRRAQKEQRTGILKIVGVLAVVAGVAFAYMKVAGANRELDGETLCPPDPVSITVLLVDVTDPMNVPQRQDFQNQLVSLRNSIPRYGQLIVANVDATSESLLAPVIVRCNPGTAADVNDTTGDPQATQRRYDQQFVRPLDAAFAEIAQASGASQSPILESVQSVALTELVTPAAANLPRKLVLVSDLLQNTPGANFYSSLPDPDDFIRSQAFRRTRTDLSGVEVELWMLERGDAATTQPRTLIDLWDRIIGEQGGTVERAYAVSG